MSGIGVPPAIIKFSESDIESIRDTPLTLKHPCHDQAVEHHVKLVTKASQNVAGFERRDGMIGQKIKSRCFLKRFDSKKQFVWLFLIFTPISNFL